MSRFGSVARIGSSRAVLAIAVLAGLVAVFVAGAVAAPAIAAAAPVSGGLVKLVYRPACHQIPARCLDFGAGPLAVCARCLGLYLGGLTSLLAALVTGRVWRPTAAALALLATPSVIDFGLGSVGLPELANLPRLIVAVPLGLALGAALACAAHDVFTSPPAAANRPPPDLVE